MINAWWQPLVFTLPPADFGGQHWRRWINTASPPPQDIVGWDEAEPIESPTYTVESRSVVVLITGHQGKG
jgi:hypothetical protein